MWSRQLIAIGAAIWLAGCGWANLYAPAGTQIGIALRGDIKGTSAQEAQQLGALMRQYWDTTRTGIQYELQLRASKATTALTIKPDRNYTRRGYTVTLRYALYAKDGKKPLFVGSASEQAAINRASSPFAQRTTEAATRARAFETAFAYLHTQITAYLRNPSLAIAHDTPLPENDLLDDDAFEKAVQDILVPAELPPELPAEPPADDTEATQP